MFSDEQIKRSMKLVKEAGPINTLLGKDTYFDLKLADDISRIRMLYAEHGYVRVNVARSRYRDQAEPVQRRCPSSGRLFRGVFRCRSGERPLDRYYITIKSKRTINIASAM